MTCKLNHDEDGIPKFLCRACNPDAFKTAPPIAPKVEAPAIDPAMRAKLVKHRIKKLRKEEKRLSDLIDDLGGRDPVQRRKLYEAIQKVEKEIDRESAQ